MLQPSFNQENASRNGLTQLFNEIQRLIRSCLCIEKCRFCDKELALGLNTDRATLHDKRAKHMKLDPLSGNNPGDLDPIAEIRDCLERKSSIRGRSDAALLDRMLKESKDLDAILVSNENHARAPASVPLHESRNLRHQIKESINASDTSTSIRETDEKENKKKQLSNRLGHYTRRRLAQIRDWLILLKEPVKTLGTELAELSLATTHAQLAAPALIHFPEQPAIYPQLSECLCQCCWEEVEIDLPLLGFCALASAEQKTLPVASGVTYDGRVKELIRAFKYNGDATLAADLASIMSIGWATLKDYMPASQILLVPVPLHKKRKQIRGYNQAELLAKKLGGLLALPVAMQALHRTKPTKPQQLLKRPQRLENVSRAFSGDKHQLQGKTIVLVDDVCTSGSTLIACAEEALRCGALSVVALTVARALLSK